ncbi:MAG TPA: hypothetical protein VFD69_18110 [Vicinamibacterales bacterium]|nr:hypothetical protein [Vicinamibacterales bacterium]
MNPIDELVERLARHPGLRFTATATVVEIESPTSEGFAVRLQAAKSEFIVAFEGWHEHFESGEEALNCVAFAYSGRCRLAVTYRGRIPVKWVMESWDDGRWIADSEVRHFVVPFWLRRRVVYRQNPNLLSSE